MFCDKTHQSIFKSVEKYAFLSQSRYSDQTTLFVNQSGNCNITCNKPKRETPCRSTLCKSSYLLKACMQLRDPDVLHGC